MQNKFKCGDNVKINSRVYLYKWDRWKELWDKYQHHNLVVDHVIDMTDIEGGEFLVVVGYPYAHFNKTAVKSDYLDNLSQI